MLPRTTFRPSDRHRPAADPSTEAAPSDARIHTGAKAGRPDWLPSAFALRQTSGRDAALRTCGLGPRLATPGQERRRDSGPDPEVAERETLGLVILGPDRDPGRDWGERVMSGLGRRAA
jgi:hypothetical protein